MTNLDGVRFNLVRTGFHDLLRMPRGTRAGEESLLLVVGSVESKQECVEPFVKEVAISGRWLHDSGNLRFRAIGTELVRNAMLVQIDGVLFNTSQLAHDRRYASLLKVHDWNKWSQPGTKASQKIRRVKLLSVKVHLPSATLNVDWVHRTLPGGASMNHINFFASGLPRRTGENAMDIGGILGYDDHTEASSAPQCHHEDLRRHSAESSSEMELKAEYEEA